MRTRITRPDKRFTITWTDDLVATLCELWQRSDLSIRDISRTMAIGKTSLFKKAMLLNLGSRPPRWLQTTHERQAVAQISPWTDEMVERLRELCTQPMSYAAIGKALGVSRCSAMSKCRCLGIVKVDLLPRQPSLPKVAKVPKPKRQQIHRLPRAINYAMQRPYPREIVKPSMLPEERDSPHRVAFLDALPSQCRFPLWGSDKKIGDVCGAPVLKGETYCSSCAAIAGSGIWCRRIA